VTPPEPCGPGDLGSVRRAGGLPGLHRCQFIVAQQHRLELPALLPPERRLREPGVLANPIEIGTKRVSDLAESMKMTPSAP
jgi:hypothetical protein